MRRGPTAAANVASAAPCALLVRKVLVLVTVEPTAAAGVEEARQEERAAAQ